MGQMRIIELDASKWANALDFLLALKAALGSCEEHGTSPDAFLDSMVWGGTNSVEPPYMVKVVCSSDAPLEVREYIALMVNVIREAREWKKANTGIDTDVSIEIVSLGPNEHRRNA